jgi:formate-dependent nitrite reductase cytochrome c552 subunit
MLIATNKNVLAFTAKERAMKYACWSVVGGWVTASVDAEGELVEFIGPVFNSITDLWKWQRANLYTEMA